MKSRALYFAGDRSVRVTERDVPDPEPGEVLVEAEVSAVSPGTELLIYRGHVSTGDLADRSIAALSDELSYPLAYGYATVGRVTAVGEAVDNDWLDERVFAFHPHAEAFVSPVSDVVRFPTDLDPERAAYLANLESAVSFALDGQPRLGERVVIFGQGVIGLLTTAVLSRFPLESLVTVDLYQRRRRISEAMGADESVEPSAVPTVSDGGTDTGDVVGFDLTYELSGNPDALQRAIDATGDAGHVLVGSWYGTKPVELTLDTRFHRSRISLKSTQVSWIDPSLQGRWTHERRLSTALDLLPEIDVHRIITDRIPFDRAGEAYELLDEQPASTLGVLLTY